MSEYLVKVKITTPGTVTVGIGKGIRGVYSSSPVTIGWDYNGTDGSLISTPTMVWEPNLEFNPYPTSKLVLTATAAAEVVIRMVM